MTDELEEVVTDLAHKVQYLVDWMATQGLLEGDGCFTFPDGDTWRAGDKP